MSDTNYNNTTSTPIICKSPIMMKVLNIGMSRNAGKFFDSVDFDSTSYNRGWTTLFFVNE